MTSEQSSAAETKDIELSGLIAPAFYEVHEDIKAAGHTHYFLKGGRGSAKSSFVSLEIIVGMMKNPDRHCVALRKVAAYLRDSVFMQLRWAIDMLGVSDKWEERINSPELIYKETGQRIIFRGADDPKKIKSIKTRSGYIGYVWFEEADQFSGMAEIRSINQSLLRGGESYTVFYSYNPPMSIKNWINLEVSKAAEGRLVHSSTYLGVPREWLGEQFILEAEHVKRVNEKIYRHEYMGEATGTGGEVFANVTVREITDGERGALSVIKAGADFGYASDPFAYVVCALERRRLYILEEVYKTGLSNFRASELMKEKGYDGVVVCDSAEPKSIRELRDLGIRAVGAKKGPDSINYGIKFLQSLDEIVIDAKKCPNAAREFSSYELERDIYGNLRAEFPDRGNHTIDAVRYALESEISRRKAKIIERRFLE
ncbi:MAG TPA: PBSX family phage terminase large subunit [Candidatus Ornithomonoglobus intestinigallinarum]|uniref:PBSX family phage terminase large subunit n=1 Tax=Candidatus Ornithomonoglobus intestinigallinarum TaxID=2840894 RepID=A0A9D1KPX8_9FIRM|nr:PBSX family phage terminase large subunit [Candidatus Ornithomonoglobus intestinigallinarum]